MNPIFQFLGLCVAVGFISGVIAKSLFFEAWRDYFRFRSGAGIYDARFKEQWCAWIHELFSCVWCLSHWVSLAVVIIWKPLITNCGILLFTFPVLDYLVAWFCIVGVSNMIWSLYWNWLDRLVEK